MVPEPQGKVEARHGGAEEGRGKCETVDRAQELSRERAGPGHAEEEADDQRGRLSEEFGDNAGEIGYVIFRFRGSNSHTNIQNVLNFEFGTIRKKVINVG